MLFSETKNILNKAPQTLQDLFQLTVCLLGGFSLNTLTCCGFFILFKYSSIYSLASLRVSNLASPRKEPFSSIRLTALHIPFLPSLFTTYMHYTECIADI